MDSTGVISIDDQVVKLEAELKKRKQTLARLRMAQKAVPVQNYTLQDANGNVALAELFGDKSQLLVIHNMGAKCKYCTLWADGFNGMLPHLTSRAGFVLVTPDAPEAQAKFAESRGWKFRMVSSQGTSFTRDLQFETDEGKLRPGVSALVKTEGEGIKRVSRSTFGPGDNYCSLYDLFDLLPGGFENWEPEFTYTEG